MAGFVMNFSSFIRFLLFVRSALEVFLTSLGLNKSISDNFSGFGGSFLTFGILKLFMASAVRSSFFSFSFSLSLTFSFPVKSFLLRGSFDSASF